MELSYELRAAGGELPGPEEVAELLDKSPQNAHYFFCSYMPDAAADVQAMSVAMGQALDQLVPETGEAVSRLGLELEEIYEREWDEDSAVRFTRHRRQHAA